MFWRRKSVESVDPLDSLARSVLREAGMTDSEVEVTASRVSFSGVRARIEREINMRPRPVEGVLLASPAAWQAAGATALVAVTAAAAFLVTGPVATPDTSLDRFLISAGTSRASSGGDATVCSLSNYSGCALSSEEVLATIVTREMKE